MSNIDELAAMLNENAEVARNDGCPLTAGQYEAAAEALVSMAEALRGTTAALVAAISLLERGGKKAAPSDTMFAMMLDDYRKAVEEARAALAMAEGGEA